MSVSLSPFASFSNWLWSRPCTGPVSHKSLWASSAPCWAAEVTTLPECRPHSLLVASYKQIIMSLGSGYEVANPPHQVHQAFRVSAVLVDPTFVILEIWCQLSAKTPHAIREEEDMMNIFQAKELSLALLFLSVFWREKASPPTTICPLSHVDLAAQLLCKAHSQWRCIRRNEEHWQAHPARNEIDTKPYRLIQRAAFAAAKQIAMVVKSKVAQSLPTAFSYTPTQLQL